MNINLAKEMAQANFPSHALTMLASIEEDLTDEIFVALAPVIGASSVDGFVTAYTKTEHDLFLTALANRVRDGKDLTVAQKRAVINIVRRVLRDETGFGMGAKAPGSTPTHRTSEDEREYECFTCHVRIIGKDALYQHRREAHGVGAPRAERVYDCFKCKVPITGIEALNEHKKTCKGTPPTASYSTPTPHSTLPPYVEPPTVPVLPTFSPRYAIDLTEIPDGRYAIESADGKARFFWKSTLKRDATLTARFVWSKYRHARERLPKGTILVRELIGDTKKLVGVQRLEEGCYHGEYEDEIKYIHGHNEAALVLYGKLSNRCGYCGKSLTDELSRDRGIGPDCWEAKHMPRIHRTEDAEAAAVAIILRDLGLAK